MFSADWLTLREPADFAARSAALTRAVVSAFDRKHRLRALDLACGTGANARYIADHVRAAQDWVLVDHDATLLDHVPARMSAWAVTRGADLDRDAGALRVTRVGQEDASFTMRRVDLRTLDDETIFEGRHLVSASALLDLVSESWLRRLADRCREAGASALFALTYDGRISCTPEDQLDEIVRRLVNDHQRTDKGFGPALGPAAVEAVGRVFADVGYRSRREQTDWILSPAAADLQKQLIAGWSQAAMVMAPSEEASISAWHRRRLSHVDEGRSYLVVGHEDIALWLE